jgi:parvulin-like peptidyl-prolyl cis-trans isomerase-like protein
MVRSTASLMAARVLSWAHELLPVGSARCLGRYGVCFALLACASSAPEGPGAARTNSRADQTGSTSGLHVPAQVVAEVQRALALSRDQALELVAEDVLLAERLVSLEPARARWIARTALARTLLASLGDEAKQQGPITSAEIAEIREQRWWQFDRPRMVQVVHAVVISADENPAARALAERIRSAVAAAPTPEEFEKVAANVSAGGLQVKVERLPPVALDGRALDPDRPPPAGPEVTNFDGEFAAAAQRLERPGELSPVIRTPFGYHVLRLVKVFEAQHPALSELQNVLRGDIMEQRARVLQNRLLDQLRANVAPERERSAFVVMEQLSTPR